MDLVREIKKLKKKRNAIILAHNYQIPEVQDIADFVGDSLELSRKAAKTKASVILFCGVKFMAETAKILSPKKIVLLPDLEAGCSLADMITADDVKKLRLEYPKAAIVCYVNSSAEVKAECDVCCTSSNAFGIVKRLRQKTVIMVPDKYLAAHVEGLLRREGIDKKIIAWNGFCSVHTRILPEYIKRLQKKYPGAKVVTHPECACSTNSLADSVESTSGMSKYVGGSDSNVFIIGTETGLLYKLQKENPGKKFIPATKLAECGYMKKIDLNKVYESLRDMKYEIKLKPSVVKKAKKAIKRMLSH